jgi:hypothetical protein
MGFSIIYKYLKTTFKIGNDVISRKKYLQSYFVNLLRRILKLLQNQRCIYYKICFYYNYFRDSKNLKSTLKKH